MHNEVSISLVELLHGNIIVVQYGRARLWRYDVLVFLAILSSTILDQEV